jgi:hypothetical protein
MPEEVTSLMAEENTGTGVGSAAAAGLLRHAVALGSLFLISKGYVKAETLQVIGYGVIAVMVIWSVVQKYGVNGLIETALRLPEGASFDDLKRVRAGEATVDVFDKSK